jgi:long-chain acyl-CoA synthetase
MLGAPSEEAMTLRPADPRPSVDPVLDAVMAAAERRPGAVALRLFGDGALREIRYRELSTLVRARAERLAAAGIREGYRVVLLGRNRPEWLLADLALRSLRATLVPLDVKLTTEQVGELVRRVEPAALALDGDLLERFSDLAPGAARVRVDDGAVTPAARASGASRPGDLDDTIAQIVFTSGSTAQPKGVMLSREGVAASLRCAVESVGLSSATELCCVIPLNHVLGFGACAATLTAGGAVTFLEELRGDLLTKAMDQTGTTVLPGPPRLFELLLTSIRAELAKTPRAVRAAATAMQAATRFARDRAGVNPGRVLFRKVHEKMGGRLQCFFSGGAALPAEVRRGLEDFGFEILEGYGLTETAAGVCSGTPAANREGTVGRPLSAVELRIANADVGGQGEIWLRGPVVMRGYFRDPEATAEVMREGGWLRTGDLGKLDRDGFLSITGRIKEIIITTAGKNVAPEEVEQQYRGIDAIREIAVLGMPSATRHGEEIHAAVVPAVGAGDGAGDGARVEEAIAARAARVPSHLRIQRVHVVEEIPRTTTLKVRRAALREDLLGRAAASGQRAIAAAEVEDGLTAEVIGVVRSVVDAGGKGPQVSPSSTLVFDLGLDSLGQVALASRIEDTLGVAVGVPGVQACKTVGDLVRLAREAPPRASSPRARVEEAAPIRVPAARGEVDLAEIRAARRLLGWLWDLTAEGLDRLPSEGPFILCPNHASHLDVVFVTACLPERHQATLCAFAKKEHFDAAHTRLAAAWVRAVPVDRLGDPQRALDAGRELLRAGRSLLIHPEGTRTRDGSLLPFRRGAAHLALETGAPLVPVCIDGAFAIYPPHARLPRVWGGGDGARPRLRVRFGEPIAAGAVDPSNGDPAHALTERLRSAVLALGAAA